MVLALPQWIKDAVKNSPVGPLARRLARRRQRRSVAIDNVRLSIRQGTPDLETAQTNLRGEFDILKTILGEPKFDFIIDAGGYIGTAAIAFARMFPKATIVSLEPSEENFALLRKNVRPYPNIVAVNKALLSDVRRLPLRDRQTGQWGYTLVENPLDRPGAGAIQDVMTTTVVQLLAEHRKQGIDVLKLDIEGSERNVLEACRPWISKTAVLLVELHERICPGCAAAFEDAIVGMEEVPVAGEKRLAVNRDLGLPERRPSP